MWKPNIQKFSLFKIISNSTWTSFQPISGHYNEECHVNQFLLHHNYLAPVLVLVSVSAWLRRTEEAEGRIRFPLHFQLNFVPSSGGERGGREVETESRGWHWHWTRSQRTRQLQHCSTAARLVTLQPRHRGRDHDLGRQLQAAQQMDLAPLISGIRVMLQIFTKLNVM